jgi:hypothetical protein
LFAALFSAQSSGVLLGFLGGLVLFAIFGGGSLLGYELAA